MSSVVDIRFSIHDYCVAKIIHNNIIAIPIESLTKIIMLPVKFMFIYFLFFLANESHLKYESREL